MFKFVKKCRICFSSDFQKYLSLGVLPLANNLVEKNTIQGDLFFPLEVMLCKKCFLSQLSVVVDPKILFNDYSYRTSVSLTFKRHFEEMSKIVMGFFPKTRDCIVLDIASNDGCLLQEFKKKGFVVLGVEPAKNIAKIAKHEGIDTIVEFWGNNAVKKVLENKKKPKIVTATNVFAHVDDIQQFVRNVKKVLDPNGIFIIEVPYALNLIEKNEFDTIYHEHLSYFLVTPLLSFFEVHGMEVFDVVNIPIHGGSIRIFVKFSRNKKISSNTKRIQEFVEIEKEKGLYSVESYKKFAEQVLLAKINFLTLLLELKKNGKKIAGYGAAAKASTLLNYCGIGQNYIDFIVDDSPLKQGKAFSGNRIPIVSSDFIKEHKPDYLVLFAWTIARELIKKTQDFQSKGKYVIPLPKAKIVSDEKDL